jgi:6-phosphofructo-2-kinase/fructose-2,6-biphosphatase
MNLHTTPRPIYLSRHGESVYNKLGKIGGDSGLSDLGEEYAKRLGSFVDEKLTKEHPHLRLWTSSLKRTILTGRYIKHDVIDGWVTMRPRVWRALDELHAGVFDGMSYEQIESIAPDEFKSRKKNKMSYRYPRGESYLDVLQRLDPIIHELERQTDPVFIIGHQGAITYFVKQTHSSASDSSNPSYSLLFYSFLLSLCALYCCRYPSNNLCLL